MTKEELLDAMVDLLERYEDSDETINTVGVRVCFQNQIYYWSGGGFFTRIDLALSNLKNMGQIGDDK